MAVIEKDRSNPMRLLAFLFLVLLSGLILIVFNEPPPPKPEGYVLKVRIAQPSGVVWQAITRKDIVDSYYLIPINQDLHRAGQFFYYGRGHEPQITAEVLDFEPGRLLRHTFAFAGERRREPTTVSYILEDKGLHTDLTLRHIGYDPDSTLFADIARGWPVIIGKLKKLLEEAPGAATTQN